MSKWSIKRNSIPLLIEKKILINLKKKSINLSNPTYVTKTLIQLSLNIITTTTTYHYRSTFESNAKTRSHKKREQENEKKKNWFFTKPHTRINLWNWQADKSVGRFTKILRHREHVNLHVRFTTKNEKKTNTKRVI